MPVNHYDNVTFTLNTSVADEFVDIYAEVVCNGDQCTANDTTEHYRVPLVKPDYITVNDLTAEQNGSDVDLTWSAPANDDGEAITESFENYDVFAISGIGQWTTIDRDGQPTYGFPQNVGTFPNMNSPFAFITFDTSGFGLNPTDYPGYYAHQGNQFLACFGSAVAGESNDDWLISPPLSGHQQTISFFAKSWTSEEGNEKFEVLYSMTDANPDSFEKIGETIEVADTGWVRFESQLPEGARYFAIRCVSENKFILMLDDITYEPGAFEILGYNVYRNGKMVEFTDATSYVDAGAPQGTNAYNVSVDYTIGESAFSNTAMVVCTSVSSPNGDTVSAVGLDGVIKIIGAEGKAVNVYTTDGKRLFSGRGTSLTYIPVAQGYYIVKIDNTSLSVMVR